MVDVFCKKIIEELNSKDELSDEILAHLINGAKTRDIYKSISDYIARAKRERKSVLELIIEDFSPILNSLTPTTE